MQTDSQLLLSLLAVRVLGGQSVPVSSPLLKGFVDLHKEANNRGWLTETVITPLLKSGKPGKKTVKVLNLTPAGEQALAASSDPGAGSVAAAAQLTALRQGLEADREALREEVRAALAAQGKEKGKGKGGQELTQLTKAVSKLGPELDKLSKAVADMTTRLQTLEAGATGGEEEKILARVNQAFTTLTAKLDGRLAGLPAPTPARQSSPAAVPETPKTPAQDSLRAVLRKAYEELCLFVESQDGVVELPRLYHESRRALPGLAVRDFHRELEKLWKNRELELHVLNEVQDAMEPDKGIERDNKLYYFVYWPNR